MAVAEGTYVILSALNTTKSIVCYGSSDAQGANVCLWTTTYDKWHDSQFVSVVNNSDGSQRMIFTLSGKSMDIENGNVAPGANVQQFSNNNTRAQKWVITPDGKSATVNGKTYNTYIMANSSNKNLVLDVSATSTADGANVQVYTKNGTNAQRWVFVPANPVPIGTYMIRSMLDTSAVMDISGSSTANGANVQLYGVNYSNAQVFIVEHQSGLARIENANSGKCLSVVNDKPQNGQNVHQWDNKAYQWYIEPYGSTTINGCTVPTYIIHYLNGTGFCIDSANGKSSPSTNIQIFEENKSKAQIWAFQPCSWLNTSLPVPASIMGSAGSEEESETIPFNNKTN
ncbi:MAG: RICIN domain-containing protein, partial [Lachnospiraceae bacterium]|nr:RICIN domain-containing protein [Lachnospiraceae bacterium]